MDITKVNSNKIDPNYTLSGLINTTVDTIYGNEIGCYTLEPQEIVFKIKNPAPEVEYISQEKNNTVVVRWKDKTVTVVRCSPNDTPDLYSAFCAALAKKIYGSTSAVYREIDNKNTENINRKKEEQKQKETAERKERERINHERKIRRIAKQMRDEAEAIELMNEPLAV